MTDRDELPGTMSAIQALKDSPIDQLCLTTIPVPPEPIPGQVLVEVGAAGVNPVDVKSRQGRGAAAFLSHPGYDDPFPWIPGWDIAGRVAGIGRGVARFAVGDRVFGMLNFPAAGHAYAQYVVARVADLCPTPDGLTDIEAAALPMAATTAWQCLMYAARIRLGQRVLITAAGGGVGHLAIQIVRAVGAHASALASARSADFARSMGADEVIDRTDPGWTHDVGQFDVVLDMYGGDDIAQLYRVVKPGGTLVTVSSVSLSNCPPSVAARMVIVAADGHCLAEVAECVNRGSLRPHVSTVLPLAEAGLAHRLIDGGRTQGKIVLDISTLGGSQ